MFASVGFFRMKLQLLHPMGGVSEAPLSCAWAGAAGTSSTGATASARASATRAKRRSRAGENTRMGTFRGVRDPGMRLLMVRQAGASGREAHRTVTGAALLDDDRGHQQEPLGDV